MYIEIERLRSRRGVRQSVSCGHTGVYIYYCDTLELGASPTKYSTKVCSVLTEDLPKTLFILEVCSFWLGVWSKHDCSSHSKNVHKSHQQNEDECHWLEKR